MKSDKTIHFAARCVCMMGRIEEACDCLFEDKYPELEDVFHEAFNANDAASLEDLLDDLRPIFVSVCS